MSLFQRIKTSVRADAHGVMDAIEDRQLLLRQYLRDAEAELDTKRGKLQSVGGELRQLEREENTTAEELTRFEADADVALAAGNDDLSRYALKAVLLRRARQRRHAERREELLGQRRELEQLLAEQTERYELLSERVHAELRAGGDDAAVDSISEEQVELELMRRKAKREVTP